MPALEEWHELLIDDVGDEVGAEHDVARFDTAAYQHRGGGERELFFADEIAGAGGDAGAEDVEVGLREGLAEDGFEAGAGEGGFDDHAVEVGDDVAAGGGIAAPVSARRRGA